MKVAISLAAIVVALVAAAGASGHARISPPVALAGSGQLFSLVVPTEKEGATTTKVVLTVPKGFSIDSFVPAPGWKRETQTKGSGQEAAVVKVTWAGGSVQTGDAAAFSFLGQAAKPGSYAFSVRQTYSDGSVVDWTGPESSDSPAPTLEAVSSFGGGRSTVEIVAIVLAGIALAVAVVALVARSGRPLA